jgi:hypothetical protein
MYAMKRTSLFLDEQLLRRVQLLAERQGVSFAAVVREALASYIARPAGAPRVPSLAGRFSSGTTDTAERADELLWRDPHA